MALIAARLWFFLLLSHAVHSARWSNTSPPDGQTVYACSGDTVTFTWQYVLDSGDVLGDEEWLYDGHSQELVAMMSHGRFFPTPTFSQRVEAVGNAGITLRKVIVGDSGNYTVEVNVYGDSGASHVLLRRSVFLLVSADLMTTDTSLHAIQRAVAVVDAHTGQFAIQLQCGTFTFTDQPPIQVEWTLPSGQKVNSTDFSNGHFNLVLGNPVQGGTYRCGIPPQHTHRVCLHANNTHQGQASVTVDMVEARLSLLEKENEQLKQKLSLQNHTDSDHQARLQKLEETARYRVAFHATFLLSETPASGTPLIFTNVHYNEGNAYNNATGYFVAPADGDYFFIESTGPSQNRNVAHYLYVDNTQIDYSYSSWASNTQISSVHGIAHLRAGQRVWIKSGGSQFLNTASSFSGFLLSRDF